MKQKSGKKKVLKELIKGVLAFFCGRIGVMGCYPLLPAFFAVCSMEGKPSLWVILGSVISMGYHMAAETALRYLFVLLVIGIEIRMYIWSNRTCSNWMAAALAACSVVFMYYAAHGFAWNDREILLTGFCEGSMVFGMTLCMHYLFRLPFQMEYMWEHARKSRNLVVPLKEQNSQKMESFASAVTGLSDAFFALSQPKEQLVTEEVSILEQEITGKLCADCDGCAICWNENRMCRQGGIRALLHAVVNHSSKEELLQEPYVQECMRYEGMVEEALQAFGRLELNQAWCNRLRENRYIIAQQLDAMAGLMEEWARCRINVDHKYEPMLALIAYEVREKGLVIEQLHIYEENKRLSIEGYVSCKWKGGIPAKNYLAAVEKAVKKPMRLGKEAKTILSEEPVLMTVFEDTVYYGLQGIAAEKKKGSLLNGDSYAFFAMDDGSYHICLSDGMGSGSRANQESEMVVDLLQKFMEAGFRKETAIKLMNSAMVLQADENTFSTLDYATIDLYTGKVELIKIGGAVTFFKRGETVEWIEEGTLPAGADVHMEVNSTKKQMQNGDFLVMVTDGVIECLNVRNPIENLADIISLTKTDNAGVLAETILNQVLLRSGGYAMDDMTVLVTGIWEK